MASPAYKKIVHSKNTNSDGSTITLLGLVVRSNILVRPFLLLQGIKESVAASKEELSVPYCWRRFNAALGWNVKA